MCAHSSSYVRPPPRRVLGTSLMKRGAIGRKGRKGGERGNGTQGKAIQRECVSSTRGREVISSSKLEDR